MSRTDKLFNKTISTKITDADYYALEDIAENSRRDSMSSLFRIAVMEYLIRHDDRKLKQKEW